MIRHVPNILSALRLLAAPFAAGLILLRHDAAALLVFAAAGLSDAADGAIARRWGVTSGFGAWLDPAADKLLMLLCFLALVLVAATPAWLAILVVARDAAIAGGWLLAKAAGLAVRSDPLALGKTSTVVQVLYVFATLLLLAFDLSQPRLAEAAAAICGLFTLASGAAYGARFFAGRTA